MEAEASLLGHSASMRIVPDCTGEGGPCQLLLPPNSSSIGNARTLFPHSVQ